MTLCYLGLGSNLNSPIRQIYRTVASIRTIPQTRVLKLSSLYLSKPYGIQAQPMFYNAVLAINTNLAPKTLFDYCKNIERNQGRVLKKRWGSRIIDIDLLLFGSVHVSTPNLTIPHPHLYVRDFVLIPLLELAPELVDNNGVPLANYLQSCESYVIPPAPTSRT